MCTDSQDMLVLASTAASHYYNRCTDGSTNPGNYGYSLVVTGLNVTMQHLWLRKVLTDPHKTREFSSSMKENRRQVNLPKIMCATIAQSVQRLAKG
jgi:hypothetical protein